MTQPSTREPGRVGWSGPRACVAAFAISLALTACVTEVDEPPPTANDETKFTQAVRRALAATAPGERAAALEEASTLAINQEFDPQLDCPVVAELAEAVPGFGEGSARLVVLLLRHIECVDVPRMLLEASRGDWNARTALLRSVALRTLSEAVRTGRLQAPQAFDELIGAGVREPAEIVRAAALEHVLVTTTDVDQRTALEASLRAQQPPLVLRLLALRSLEPRDPNDSDPNNPNDPNSQSEVQDAP